MKLEENDKTFLMSDCEQQTKTRHVRADEEEEDEAFDHLHHSFIIHAAASVKFPPL